MSKKFLRTKEDKIFFSCVLLIPVLAVSIVGYVIASNNYNVSCDTNKMIKMSNWLIINSTITLVSTLILTGFYMSANQKNGYLIYTLYINIVYILFLLAFNIIGTIKLVKYGDLCKVEASSLWITMLATIIIQYVIIAVKPFLMFGVMCCGECIYCCDDGCCGTIN